MIVSSVLPLTEAIPLNCLNRGAQAPHLFGLGHYNKWETYQMTQNQFTVSLSLGINNFHLKIESAEDVNLVVEAIEQFYQKLKKSRAEVPSIREANEQ